MDRYSTDITRKPISKLEVLEKIAHEARLGSYYYTEMMLTDFLTEFIEGGVEPLADDVTRKFLNEYVRTIFDNVNVYPSY